MQPYCDHFQLYIEQLWPLDQFEDCLIWLAYANHEGCNFLSFEIGVEMQEF